MAVVAKGARLDNPNRSHWFGIEYGKASKEELFPTVEVDLPRVGTVSARFSVDRYVHSSGWSDWRIYARDIEPSNGIGEAMRQAVNDAGRPLILAWLASDAYAASRARAVAFAVKRVIEGERSTADYSITNARAVLSSFRHELAESDARHLDSALAELQRASDHLAKVGAR